MENLLDHLAAQLDMPFLSNLYRPENLPAVLCALRQVQFEAFPETQWREAARYLTGNYSICADSKDDVVKVIENHFNQIESESKKG